MAADSSADQPGFVLKRNSAWDRQGVARFLNDAVVPLRLGVESKHNPLIVTLWFEFRDDAIWCAAHRDSLVVKVLQDNPACAVDISTNDIPYRGVRGAGTAACLPAEGAEALARLIERYLGGDDSQLARWLKSREDDEVALKIMPNWLTSWDFSERMADI
jgi:nitroimidazol reductase NimA-like FMN-containing flavoprotein (pyridoxamine 5'-phosphate oxidase superfamily)